MKFLKIVKGSCIGISLILFGLLAWSCKKKEPGDNRIFYRATSNKDTAELAIETTKDRFFGQYQIYYSGRAVKDSGSVEGEISADTLRGRFRYKTYGGDINTIPVIFLKRNDKLITGKGVPVSLFGLVHFSPKHPIDFNNPRFVFHTHNAK